MRHPPPRPSKRGLRPAGPARREAGLEESGLTILYGWHPVTEALRNPRRRPVRLLATENGARRLAEELAPSPIDPVVVRADEIGRLLEPDAVHQGLYLEAEPLDGSSLEDLPDDAFVLALDQVTDPHNVGAILRTAAAFAVDAVVTTGRHSPSFTGILAKAASGGLEHVPIVTVRNLAQALIALGDRGFARIGLDSEAGTPLREVSMGRPAILVLGAEGRGLRQRTRECCDVLARLDMPGAIRSLNVSNAAAIALYALATARS